MEILNIPLYSALIEASFICLLVTIVMLSTSTFLGWVFIIKRWATGQKMTSGQKYFSVSAVMLTASWLLLGLLFPDGVQIGPESLPALEGVPLWAVISAPPVLLGLFLGALIDQFFTELWNMLVWEQSEWLRGMRRAMYIRE